MSARIKVGDTVLVRAGKDKGREGEVLAVDYAKNRVVVSGVNSMVRHQKSVPGAAGSQQGGIVHKEAPLHLSNVMLVDGDGKATRLGSRPEKGTKTRTDGSTLEVTRRVRVSKRTGKDI